MHAVWPGQATPATALTDGGNGGHDLAQLQLVQDGGLTRSIETDLRDGRRSGLSACTGRLLTAERSAYWQALGHSPSECASPSWRRATAGEGRGREASAGERAACGGLIGGPRSYQAHPREQLGEREAHGCCASSPSAPAAFLSVGSAPVGLGCLLLAWLNSCRVGVRREGVAGACDLLLRCLRPAAGRQHEAAGCPNLLAGVREWSIPS